jgi:dienelactone hydrolase
LFSRICGVGNKLPTLLCWILAALFVSAPCLAQTEKLDAELRDTVSTVPVPATGTAIVVTSYRPRGDGPFPWLILSHGTATTLEANRAIGRYRPLNPVREWVRRGYAVLVPVRRGYGASGGEHLGDAYGSCSRPDFRRAGGFASIYTASKRPDGLVAVLAFSPGRGGDPDKRRGEPCASDRMAALLAAIAPQLAVPVLWFYAENDEFIGPRVQKLWFESFRSAGGRGELVVAPPFPSARAHGVFPSSAGTPIWTTAVAAFIKSQGLALPF